MFSSTRTKSFVICMLITDGFAVCYPHLSTYLSLDAICKKWKVIDNESLIFSC